MKNNRMHTKGAHDRKISDACTCSTCFPGNPGIPSFPGTPSLPGTPGLPDSPCGAERPTLNVTRLFFLYFQKILCSHLLTLVLSSSVYSIFISIQQHSVSEQIQDRKSRYGDCIDYS